MCDVLVPNISSIPQQLAENNTVSGSRLPSKIFKVVNISKNHVQFHTKAHTAQSLQSWAEFRVIPLCILSGVINHVVCSGFAVSGKTGICSLDLVKETGNASQL